MRALTALERAVLVALGRADAPAGFRALRTELGCTRPALSNAIQVLRWRGFIQFGRLALVTPPAAPPTEPPGAPSPAPAPAPRTPRRLALPEPEPLLVPAARPRAPAPARRIGDVEPVPPGWNRTAWAAQRRIQGYSAGARADGSNADQRILHAELTHRAAARARAACRVEQAKLALRRRGYAVYRADVTGGPADRYRVGHELLTEAELIERAAQRGGDLRSPADHA
ncbi:MAG: hypothetical protein ACK4Z0_05675 [Sphingomonadaceae bacterium]